ncbi:hypothetical protein [Acidovorax sp. NB1]|uniref:hypothetical protein n=1 Tax=Acidovorax sp. NB1 TaxID=1943571 RepID=UPI0010E41D25|nr:hypothetical protein [Acidovorax sp. NB1]GDY38460.1 hypothetical protein ACINB_43520 [Acidovorax sp. NB1]
MKTLLIALAMTAASSAFAAGDTQEATPYTNSKAQAHGEEHKKGPSCDRCEADQGWQYGAG